LQFVQSTCRKDANLLSSFQFLIKLRLLFFGIRLFLLGRRLHVFVIRFGDFQIYQQIFEYRVVQWFKDFYKVSFFYKDRIFFWFLGKEKTPKQIF